MTAARLYGLSRTDAQRRTDELAALMELDGIYARYFNMQFEGLDIQLDT